MSTFESGTGILLLTVFVSASVSAFLRCCSGFSATRPLSSLTDVIGFFPPAAPDSCGGELIETQEVVKDPANPANIPVTRIRKRWRMLVRYGRDFLFQGILSGIRARELLAGISFFIPSAPTRRRYGVGGGYRLSNEDSKYAAFPSVSGTTRWVDSQIRNSRNDPCDTSRSQNQIGRQRVEIHV